MRVLKAVFFTIFCAACCVAQQESLTIGPGDVVSVKVLEAPELAQTGRVTDAGELALVLGGNVKITGLSPAQAAHVIENALVTGHFILTPHVTVTVDHYVTQNVSIEGQVRTPGSFQIDTPRPVLDALALAGGITELASRKITIQRRGSKERIEYFLSNQPDVALDANVLIYPGDTIIVPKAGVVYILGDVGRPGGFAMATNDSKLSLLQAMSLAGGTPPTAVPSHARLIRKQADGGYVELPLQLSAIQKGKQSDVQLQADDIVYVPFSYVRNMAVGVGGLISAASSAAIYKF